MDAVTATVIVAMALLFAYVRGRIDGGRIELARMDAELKKAAAGQNLAAAIGAAVSRSPAIEFKPPVAIGEHFRYLGIDMLCTAHSAPTPMGPLQCVKSEYVAADGVLRMTTFVDAEIDALRCELDRAAGTTTAAESSVTNAKDQP